MSAHLVSRAVALALVASMAASSPTSVARASTAALEPDAASGRKAAAVALRARGLDLGYNLDHAEALEAFEEAIAADPYDPTAYRLAAGTAWVALLFKQGTITVADYLGQARTTVARPTPDAELNDRFHRFLDRSLALSEQQLRSNPRDVAAHYHVGAAFGFVASYTATVNGRVLGSFGAARRAYREHQRVLELDPTRHDAGLIVGTYRYAIANLSMPMRIAARLAGFGADRDSGVRLVEAAARHPSDVRANALFTLILIYNRERRYDDALRVIHELQERYPRNRLLWLEAGQTALRAGRPADARAALEQGLARLGADPRPRALGEEARWRDAYTESLAALKEHSK
jgi:tetratricopeptide (TPR) repeat protein